MKSPSSLAGWRAKTSPSSLAGRRAKTLSLNFEAAAARLGPVFTRRGKTMVTEKKKRVAQSGAAAIKATPATAARSANATRVSRQAAAIDPATPQMRAPRVLKPTAAAEAQREIDDAAAAMAAPNGSPNGSPYGSKDASASGASSGSPAATASPSASSSASPNAAQAPVTEKRGRGRPKGSKTRAATPPVSTETIESGVPAPSVRGSRKVAPSAEQGAAVSAVSGPGSASQAATRPVGQEAVSSAATQVQTTAQSALPAVMPGAPVRRNPELAPELVNDPALVRVMGEITRDIVIAQITSGGMHTAGVAVAFMQAYGAVSTAMAGGASQPIRQPVARATIDEKTAAPAVSAPAVSAPAAPVAMASPAALDQATPVAADSASQQSPSAPAATDTTETASRQPPAVPIDQSVTDDYIVCLEDNKHLKMLKRWLSTRYNMTPDEYRKRWGLPGDYPMIAPSYARQRRQMALEAGLGRKKAS